MSLHRVFYVSVTFKLINLSPLSSVSNVVKIKLPMKHFNDIVSMCTLNLLITVV